MGGSNWTRLSSASASGVSSAESRGVLAGTFSTTRWRSFGARDNSVRCAVFELVARRDVPARVVIDEYIAVAHAFEADAEAGFLNGALDAIARRKRAREFGLPVPDGELEF